MLKLFINRTQEVLIETFTFPAGETSVKLVDKNFNSTRTVNYHGNLDATIMFKFEGNNDIINLLLVTDAIKTMYHNVDISLRMSYIPYARQDRVCNIGEALSIKVIANLINSQNYKNVYVEDPHSDVSSALINNCRVETLSDCGFMLKYKCLPDNTILVSPDAGANKKIYEFAKMNGYKEVVRADKTRDVATGKITGTVVYSGGLKIDALLKNYPEPFITDKDFLILDDILDAGGTFIPLAQELRKLTTGNVYLYVTHGLFTKGRNGLDKDITKIFTRNLMNETIDTTDFIERI